MGRFNLKQLLYERLIRPILFVHDTPRSKAGGVGLGVFIAFTPTVGIQMPIALAAATVFGVNQPLCVAMAWLTNPVTVPPVYYLEYRIGCWMLQENALGSLDDFWKQWETVSAAYPSYWARVTHLAGDVGYPLFLGSLPLALLLALISYPLTLWFCTRRQRAIDAATIHPVAGEILPEPAHDALPGGESSVLSLDAATRERLEQARKSASGGGGGRPGPGAMGALFLASLLALHGCAEPQDRYSLHATQVESRTEGELPLFFAACDPQTSAVVGPYHASEARDRWLQSKVEQASGGAPLRCFALSLYRFAGDGSFALPSAGVRLEFETPTGRIASVPASELLAKVAHAADRPLLAAELGAAGVPALAAGQSLRLLVVAPAGVDLANCAAVRLLGSEGDVVLAKAMVPAVAWDEFRSQPERARFDELFAGRPKSER